MDRNKLTALLTELKKELEKASQRQKEALKEYIEVNKTSRTSWSAAGERVLGENNYELAKSRTRQLEEVIKEIEAATNSKTNVVSAPCWVKLQIKSPASITKEFYFLTETIALKGLSILSSNSIIGKQIMGKSKGDKVSFELSDGLQEIEIIDLN